MNTDDDGIMWEVRWAFTYAGHTYIVAGYRIVREWGDQGLVIQERIAGRNHYLPWSQIFEHGELTGKDGQPVKEKGRSSRFDRKEPV